MNERCDLKAARAELDALKARARDLEATIAAEMRAQLRDLLLGVSQVRDAEDLIESARRFVDAGR